MKAILTAALLLLAAPALGFDDKVGLVHPCSCDVTFIYPPRFTPPPESEGVWMNNPSPKVHYKARAHDYCAWDDAVKALCTELCGDNPLYHECSAPPQKCAVLIPQKSNTETDCVAVGKVLVLRMRTDSSPSRWLGKGLAR